jgi:hypothetical protein
MTTETTAARAADLSSERATLRETATMRLDDFDADFGPSQAVTLALYLALIAPNEDKTMQAAELAGRIASVCGLTGEDLEPCKAVAISLFSELAPGYSTKTATEEGIERLKTHWERYLAEYAEFQGGGEVPQC